jgi:hypothetical protein
MTRKWGRMAGLMALIWASMAGGTPVDMLTLHAQTAQVLNHLRPASKQGVVPKGFQQFSLAPPPHKPTAGLPPTLTHTLDVLNGALYFQAWEDGLLRHNPLVHTQPMAGADVWVLPGLQGQSVISAAVAPDADLALHDREHLDPVLTRWFVLLHEAAHTELGEIQAPFVNPNWDPKTNQAMADLLFDPGRLGNQTFGVFDETFADVYGALMLMRLAPEPADAVKVVNAMHQERLDEHHQQLPLVQDGLFDPHAAVNGLGELCDRLKHADFQQWTHMATPDELRQEALAETSAVVVQWLVAHPAQFQGDFDWAMAHPDNLIIGRVTAQQRLVAFRKNRALSYLLAPWANVTVAQSQTFGSPLFQAQLAVDERWRLSFAAQTSQVTRLGLTGFIAGVPAPQAMEAPDFQRWVNDTSGNVLTVELMQADQAWLNARYVKVAHALGLRPTESLNL